MRVTPHMMDSVIRFLLYVLIFWLPYSPAVVETCIGLALGAWIIKRGLGAKDISDFRPAPTPLDPYILFFILACICSVLGSVSFDKSLHAFFSKTLEWFVAFYLAVEVFNQKKHFRILVGVLLLSSVVAALDATWQFFTAKDIFYGHTIDIQSRATAAFKTPNSLSAFLIFPILVAFSMLWVNIPLARKIYYGLAFVALGAGLIWTFSRGAWLAVGLGLCLYVLLAKKKLYYQAPGRELAFGLL